MVGMPRGREQDELCGLQFSVFHPFLLEELSGLLEMLLDVPEVLSWACPGGPGGGSGGPCVKSNSIKHRTVYQRTLSQSHCTMY